MRLGPGNINKYIVSYILPKTENAVTKKKKIVYSHSFILWKEKGDILRNISVVFVCTLKDKSNSFGSSIYIFFCVQQNKKVIQVWNEDA